MGKLIHRVGTEAVPKFGGVRRECDPGAIPPQMFRDLVNARLIDAPGSPVKSRGGQEKASTLLSGEIRGIFSPEYQFNDDETLACPECGAGGLREISGSRLYIVNQTPISLVSGLFFFSKNQTPRIRFEEYGAPGEHDNEARAFGDGFLYIGGTTGSVAGNVYLRRMTLLAGDVPTILDDIAYTTTAPTQIPFISAMAKYGGVVYLSMGDGAPADARTYTLTGGVLVLDDTPGDTMNNLIVLGSDLYGNRGQGLTWRRKTGGVWGNFAATEAMSSMIVVYSSKIYATNLAGTKVYSLTGTTFVLEHTAAANTVISCLATFNGFLFYLNTIDNLDGTFSQRIGRFDGATWNDAHKDLSAQFGVNTPGLSGLTVDITAFLGEMNGDLLVLLFDESEASCHSVVLRSPATDTPGSWIEEVTHHEQNSIGAFNNHGTVG